MNFLSILGSNRLGWKFFRLLLPLDDDDDAGAGAGGDADVEEGRERTPTGDEPTSAATDDKNDDDEEEEDKTAAASATVSPLLSFSIALIAWAMVTGVKFSLSVLVVPALIVPPAARFSSPPPCPSPYPCTCP